MSFDQEKVTRIIEGALFAAGQPMNLEKLSKLFLEEECPPTTMLVDAIAELKQVYADRGVQLKEVASGFRFQVREEVGEWVSRLWEEKPPRYSRALLETLALIAYRQPITRGEIEEIRGVSVSTHITKTLLERDWIRVVGHRDVPGRPAMYGTTRGFLDYFNLKNMDELPSLAEIRDLDTINAELELSEKAADGDAAEAELDSPEANQDRNPVTDGEFVEQAAVEEVQLPEKAEDSTVMESGSDTDAEDGETRMESGV